MNASQAQRMKGELHFGLPSLPMEQNIQDAIVYFRSKHSNAPTLIMVSEMQALELGARKDWDGIEIRPSKSVIGAHVWVGAPANGGKTGKTFAEEARARLEAKKAAHAAAATKVAALETRIEEHRIKLADMSAINRAIQLETWRLFTGVPLLPAGPAIAGLLPAPAPKTEPDTPQEAVEETPVLVILPKVEKAINPEYVLAFKAAQSASKDWRAQWEPFSQMMKRGEWPPQWITREAAPASEPDQSAAADEMVEQILPTGQVVKVTRDQYVPPTPAPLPQSLQSPDDAIKQIAEAKSIGGPRINELPPSGTNPLSMDAYLQRHRKSREDVIEDAARRKAEVDPALIDDVLSALQAAIDEPENDAAQMLPHGLELVGDQFQISVVHPSGCALLVGVNINPDDGYEWRFVASREGVRELVKGWQKKAQPEKKIA